MATALTASDEVMTIYTTGLRNQHAVENQAIQLLERQIGRLENYPELRTRMQHHLDESHAQVERLDRLLAALGTSSSALKDAAMSFMGNVAALAHAPASDEVIKNSLANYAFEHYEIAGYKSLIAIAEEVGDAEAITLLGESLSEEEAMAQWIDEHLKDTTLTFLHRSEQGEKAGL
jgi:ferritin-like metal-binding protein YciE